MTFDREKLAWAAGLFEGEGCFSYSNERVRSISASLGMTDEDVVRTFHSTVGVGTIYLREPEQAHYKSQWVWKTGCFEDVQAVMAFLWPWLKSRRRSKIKELLVRYHGDAPIWETRTRAIEQALSDLTSPLWGRRWRSDRTQKDIAREFGVSSATVSLIKSRGALRHSMR